MNRIASTAALGAARGADTRGKKVMVVSTAAESLINIRGDMMAEMLNRGHRVIGVAPESADLWAEEFQGLGFGYISVPLARTGINPLKDIRTLMSLYRLFNREKPDIIFTYQAKSVSYGCIAGKLAGVSEIYGMLAGLGSVFQLTGAKGSLIRTILCTQYKVALSFCRKVFFQNQDDAGEFVKRKMIQPDKVVMTNGSGVNLQRFFSQPMPENSVFLFVGRLLRDKGLVEYMDAAQKVKEKYPEARFWILGSMETNPMALKLEELEPYLEEGSVEYLGSTRDVRPFLRDCFAFVLPSYREGTPRSTLEAMATGRPIITTDAPGCRETVEEGVNGLLVPVKNSDALAEKMIWLLEHRDEAQRMGKESLRICRERFDVNQVNQVIISTMGLDDLRVGIGKEPDC